MDFISDIADIVIGLIIIAICVLVNLLTIGAFVYVLSLLFGFTFSYKIVVGVYLILIMLKNVVGKK